jgi:sulfur-carrier protein adenylyltransferase/sulfurtransferase
MIKSISVSDYKQMRDTGAEHQLIDVREPNEYEHCNIGGDLIPLATVMRDSDRIRRDVPVVVMCRSGKRSATAIMQLEVTHGFTNLVNLDGGILQWSSEIDPSIPRY